MQNQPLELQLSARKDDLLDLIGAALRAAGLEHINVMAIKFDMAARLPACPPGKRWEWVAKPQPDGSVEYVMECK